jgi:hypothetical protein
MAEDMDSPFAVTRAESAVTGIMSSREVGREVSLFQGPGESPDISGEGSGVTSAIAFNIGEDRAELGAEPKFELLPTLVAKTFFILGVRANEIFDDLVGSLVDSLELRAVVFALAAVTVHPGIISVCIRSPALRGLEYWFGESKGRRRDPVSRGGRGEELAKGFGGGEGAIVFDLNIDVEFGVWSKGNDTGIAEFWLVFCSFIAAAVATLLSADTDSDEATSLLS